MEKEKERRNISDIPEYTPLLLDIEKGNGFFITKQEVPSACIEDLVRITGHLHLLGRLSQR